MLKWYFSVTFSKWNNGGEGGVDFREGAYEGTETCQNGLYVCVFDSLC